MRGRERGMVTAELAVGMIVAAVVALAGIWGIGVMTAQMRCVDVAGTVARELARGDEAAANRALAGTPGGRPTVERKDGLVSVRLDWRSPGFGALPGMPVHAAATAREEGR